MLICFVLHTSGSYLSLDGACLSCLNSPRIGSPLEGSSACQLGHHNGRENQAGERLRKDGEVKKKTVWQPLLNAVFNMPRMAPILPSSRRKIRELSGRVYCHCNCNCIFMAKGRLAVLDEQRRVVKACHSVQNLDPP